MLIALTALGDEYKLLSFNIKIKLFTAAMLQNGMCVCVCV
jgi:hypothetical protein